MRVVDVSVNSEESFEDNFDDVNEVSGKGDAQLTREHLFVIELRLNPRHQKIYVLCCTYLQRGFYVMTISPQILIFWSR